MKALIVTADDVGLHEGMTLGAIEAHQRGIVTACSVAACGPALEHAAGALATAPDLDVGAHLMLVEARPVRPPSAIPTLMNSRGMLHANYRAFVARYAAGRIAIADVEEELRGQLERLTAAGLRLTHLNSHQHVHLLPAIFRVVVRLAREFSIPYIRVVRDAGPGGGPMRRAAVHAANLLGRRVRNGGIQTNSRTVGVFQAGRLSSAALLNLLPYVEGLTELVTHPGVGNAALAQRYDWGYDWDGERAALCDPEVRRAIAAQGILLRGIRG